MLGRWDCGKRSSCVSLKSLNSVYPQLSFDSTFHTPLVQIYYTVQIQFKHTDYCFHYSVNLFHATAYLKTHVKCINRSKSASAWQKVSRLGSKRCPVVIWQCMQPKRVRDFKYWERHFTTQSVSSNYKCCGNAVWFSLKRLKLFAPKTWQNATW